MRHIVRFTLCSLLLLYTSCGHAATRNASFFSYKPIFPKKDVAAVPSRKILTFGQLVSQSGPMKSYSRSISAGILASFEHFNEKRSKNELKLRLKTIDTHNNPATACHLAKQLRKKGTDMFIGNMGTRQALLLLPQIEQKKIASFFPWAGHRNLRKSYLTHLINGSGMITPHIDKLAEYISEQLQHTNVVLVHSDSEFGNENANYTAAKFEKAGIDTINKVSYSNKDLLLDDVVEKIIEKKPQAVVFLGTSKPAAKITKKMMNRGICSPHFLGIDSTLFVSPILKDKSIDFYYTSSIPSPTDVRYPIVAAYQRDLEKYAPKEEPNILSLSSYIHASIVTQAIKSLEQREQPIIKENILTEIATMHNRDIGGFLIDFDRRTRHAYPLHISIMKG